MSKFLAFGVTLEAIERATAAPARMLGLEDRIGTLQPDAERTSRSFDVRSGSFASYDIARDMDTAERC